MVNNNQNWKSRLINLYGKEVVDYLGDCHVCVLGLGGVGSFCATAIARSGIGKITIVDFDTIAESNINRQEFALNSNLGKLKVDVAKNFILDINPQAKVFAYDVAISEGNAAEIIKDCDYVIDCIDDVSAKVQVAKFCQEKNINLVSCMGTAQRTDPNQFMFENLFNTADCPLCKKMRQECKKQGINKLTVLYSTQKPVRAINKSEAYLDSSSFVSPGVEGKRPDETHNTLDSDSLGLTFAGGVLSSGSHNALGSSSFVPPVAGFLLASYAVNNLIEQKG